MFQSIVTEGGSLNSNSRSHASDQGSLVRYLPHRLLRISLNARSTNCASSKFPNAVEKLIVATERPMQVISGDIGNRCLEPHKGEFYRALCNQAN